MSETTPPDDNPDRDPPPAERKIRRALVEIRREGWKVAAIYAVIDASLATLLVNLAATVTGVPGLPARLPIPEAVLNALQAVGLPLADPTVTTGAVLGVAVGGVVLVVEVAWRSHRPLVEQFESANPDLNEALRTARDVVDHGGRSRMARRLYEDVLDDLKDASSVGLLDLRRVTVTILVVAVVSVATIQLAVVDVSLTGMDGSQNGDTQGGIESEYGGLQNGSSILGEPEDVPAGEQELDATIDTSGSGSEAGTDADSAAAYDNSGFDDSTTIETQRAGFDERERLEDAELIREYNLRIREESEES
ncbi:hypothetical protein ACERIT_12715 [Halopenitus sp. H-Gu1]|uniref:DUF7502 family protein n=1 Tax=Halopenitus sp. H-Gu1 TaxID=3242697 RepID=UPI00359DB58A